MIVSRIDVPLFLPPPDMPRSEGVHLSSIIRCIATEQGILKPEWAEELSLVDARTITDPVAILRISIGLAWEQYYIPRILGPVLGVTDHPGEYEVDGVYMTPDGESVSVIITDRQGRPAFGDSGPYLPVVHEVKATYKSTRTVGELESQWMWVAQVKGYCKAVSTRFSALHVLFLCGDYKYPIRPVLSSWLIEFDQAEIDGNWDLMTEYRDYRLRIEDSTE